MIGCPTPPRTCSPISIRPSVTRSWPRPGRSASWPGPGTGKTRAISRRVAYAVETGAVAPTHALVVTFTDKAAGEMRERLAALGRPGIAAATFHSAALRQLRHFWPRTSRRRAARDPRVEGLAARRPGPDPARWLPLRGRPRPGRRDRVGEGASDPTRRRTRPTVEADGHDGPAPRPAVRAALPTLRDGQGAGRAGSTSRTCSS